MERTVGQLPFLLAVVTNIEMPGELNGVDLAWAVEAKAWELLRLSRGSDLSLFRK
jgi:hypothetical protein